MDINEITNNMANNDLRIKATKEMLQTNQVCTERVFNVFGEEIEGYKLITTDDYKPIRIMSSKYQVLQHIDAFDDTVYSLNKIGIPYDIRKIETNMGRRGHHSIHITFGFPDITLNVDGSDIIATLDLFNGCDGIVRFARIFGAFRLLCSNGMMIGRKLFMERHKHTAGFEMQNLEKGIIKEKDNFYKLGEFLQTLQTIKINENIKKSIIKAGFPKKVIDDIDQMYLQYDEFYKEETQFPDTLWAMYQVLTNWMSNVVMAKNIYRGLILQKELNKVINHIIKEQ